MDPEEAARCLGCGFSRLDEGEQARILRTGEELESLLPLGLRYRVIKKTPAGGEGLALPGKDAEDLLRDAEEVLVFCATLGAESARQIRRRFLLDPSLGMIADACASALLEGYLDGFEKEQNAYYLARGRYLTDRFSPGYGDLPLTVQRQICLLLETETHLGVTVTGSCMLLPEKTVTGIMGVCPVPQPHRALGGGGCEKCAAFKGCRFRQQGRTCHG